jgi:hypothetical protein
MAGATAAALGVTWVMATKSGGTPEDVQAALIAVAVGSVATFAPAMLRIGREHWGVAVLFCGVVRVMIALLVAWMLAKGANQSHRPLYMGIAAGAFLVLIVETFSTVKILSAIERRREALKAPPTTPDASATASTQA